MNAVAKVQPVLIPQTFDQLVRFAEMAAASDLMPRDYKNKPANIMLAVQMGSELGMQPMQALQSIAVINGRPGVWGDGLIGLCLQSPLCEDIAEHIEGEGEQRIAVCVAKRRGKSPTTGRFSVADAKKAGLWGKQGPWQQYPDRMLQNRARGFALRDAFPDLLRGLKTVEELRDIPDAEPKLVHVTREPVRRAPPPKQVAAPLDTVLQGDDIPDFDADPGAAHEPEPPPEDKLAAASERLIARLRAVQDIEAYNAIMGDPAVAKGLAKIAAERPDLEEAIERVRASTLDRISEIAE